MAVILQQPPRTEDWREIKHWRQNVYDMFAGWERLDDDITFPGDIHSGGNIIMPEDAWIGIGAADERIIFDGSAGTLAFADTKIAVDTIDEYAADNGVFVEGVHLENITAAAGGDGAGGVPTHDQTYALSGYWRGANEVRGKIGVLGRVDLWGNFASSLSTITGGVLYASHAPTLGDYIGHVTGAEITGVCTAGDVGTAGNERNVYGAHIHGSITGGQVFGDVYGAYVDLELDGGVIEDDTGAGNAFGVYITLTDDGTQAAVDGLTYGLYVDGNQGSAPMDYGIYETGSVGNYLSSLAIGGSVTIQGDKIIVCDTYTDEGINAAIDALGAEGGIVILPEGIYIIVGEITIDQNNTTLMGMGPGTILDATGWVQTAPVINITGKTHCVVRDLVIKGNAGGGATFDLIYCSGANYIQLLNCELHTADRIAANLTNCDFSVISDCYIYSSDSSGIYGVGSAYCTVSGNRFEDVGNYAVTLLGAGQGASVTNNSFEDCVHGVALLTSGTVTGNTINGIGGATTGRGIYLDGADSVASGNVISDYAYGITVDGDYIAITGNTISSSRWYGILTGAGRTHLAILGNTINVAGNTFDSIRLAGTNHYSVISNNVIHDAAGGAERGIHLIDSDYCEITGNVSEGHDTCGIELDATSDNNHVAWNNLEGEAVAKVIDGGSNNTIINATAGVIAMADGTSLNLQEDITFLGATTENLIKFPDNLADAWSVQEGANKYITFDTTDNAEQLEFFVDKMVIAKNASDEGINAAIDALGAEGGPIWILEDTGTVNAQIDIDQNATSIQGGGYGSVIDSSGWSADHTIDLNGKDFFSLSNLRIVGKAGGGNDKYLLWDNGVSSDMRLNNVFFESADWAGVAASSEGLYNVMQGCKLDTCDICNAYLTWTASIVNANIFKSGGAAQHSAYFHLGDVSTISNNVFYYPKGMGLYLSAAATYNTITGNIFDGVAKEGMKIQGVYNNIVGNLWLSSSFDNLYVDSDYVVMTGNLMRTGGNTYDDTELNTANYFVISGSLMSSAAGKSERAVNLVNSDFGVITGIVSDGHDTAGIALDANSASNVIIGNNIRDATRISDAGDNNLIFDHDTANNATLINHALELSAADGVRDNLYALKVSNLEATDDRSFGAYIQAGSTAVDYNVRGYDHDAGNELWHVDGAGDAYFKGTITITGDLDVLQSGASSALAGPVEIAEATGPIIGLRRVDTTIAAGNRLGAIAFYGDDPAATELGAEIRASATDDWAAGDFPTELSFWTCPDAGAAPLERVTIMDDGVIDLLAGQLKFPAAQVASADANTLDDYEEGTWTPTLTRLTGGSTLTYNQQLGRYTKVGNIVTASCQIVINAVTAQGAGINVVSLPITAGATYQWPGVVTYNTAVATEVQGVQAVTSQAYAYLVPAANTDSVINENWVAAKYFYFSIVYSV